MSRHIIGVHQPNYFPWLGYFRKIKMCDTFVFLDKVAWNKKGYTRRVKMRKQDNTEESKWLTVPLQNASDNATIETLIVDQSVDWAEQHFRILANTYHDAPHKSEILNWLEVIFNEVKKYDHLTDINRFIIKEIASLLSLEFNPASWTGDVENEPKGLLNYRIVEALNGTHYVRGTGEKKYNKYEGWNNVLAPIIIETDIENWKEIVEKNLPEHLFGTSILDALFNYGLMEVSAILDR